jgi:uncharacterized protein (DUF924 family)
MMLSREKREEILCFLFGENTALLEALWFAESVKVDREIEKRFKDLLVTLSKRDLSRTGDLAEKLALILLFDQFPRNIFRNRAESFAYDSLSLGLAKDIIEKGEDRDLKPIERFFVYLPLEHSENKENQELSVKKFQKFCRDVDEDVREIYQVFLDYAVKHKVIIDRFGRFPHRNEILGRKTTDEEEKFLKEPDSSF